MPGRWFQESSLCLSLSLSLSLGGDCKCIASSHFLMWVMGPKDRLAFLNCEARALGTEACYSLNLMAATQSTFFTSLLSDSDSSGQSSCFWIQQLSLTQNILMSSSQLESLLFLIAAKICSSVACQRGFYSHTLNPSDRYCQLPVQNMSHPPPESPLS